MSSERFQTESFRALVVDDYRLMRAILMTSLRNIGVQNISQASNGKEALDMVTSGYTEGSPYQVILCDLNMPEMTGLDLLESLRGTHEFKDIPFILVTVEMAPKKIASALAHGGVYYIHKPLSPSALEAEIGKLFKKMWK